MVRRTHRNTGRCPEDPAGDVKTRFPHFLVQLLRHSPVYSERFRKLSLVFSLYWLIRPDSEFYHQCEHETSQVTVLVQGPYQLRSFRNQIMIHPTWGTPLEAVSPSEVAEDFSHFGRQHFQRSPSDIPPDLTDFDGAPQKSAPSAALY